MTASHGVSLFMGKLFCAFPGTDILSGSEGSELTVLRDPSRSGKKARSYGVVDLGTRDEVEGNTVGLRPTPQPRPAPSGLVPKWCQLPFNARGPISTTLITNITTLTPQTPRVPRGQWCLSLPVVSHPATLTLSCLRATGDVPPTPGYNPDPTLHD